MHMPAICKLKSIFLILLFFVSAPVLAQKKFQEGFIVLSSGDSLFGQVRDRKETPYRVDIYSKIRFKSNGKISKRYSPKQLQGYGYGNNTFVAFPLRRKSFILQETYFIDSKSGKWQFLKKAVVGNLSCYYLEVIDQDNNSIDEIALIYLKGFDFMIRAEQGIFGLKKKAVAEYLHSFPEIIELINANHFKSATDLCRYFNSAYQF